MTMHEDFSRAVHITPSSNRVFGGVFVAAFAVVALWPVPFDGAVRWWSLALGAVVLLFTLAAPGLLSYPNRLWLRFGALLHRLMSPLVLAVMFYLVITPMGLLMRALGKDLLKLGRGASTDTYWIKRDPPGPEPSTMSKQF